MVKKKKGEESGERRLKPPYKQPESMSEKPNLKSPETSGAQPDLSSESSSDSGRTPNRWLITGGCGFIGTSLIKYLVARGGNRVRVLDNLTVGTRDDLSRVCTFHEGGNPEAIVELVVGDILDPDLALRVAKDMDVIVHLAANTGVLLSIEEPRKDCETNVLGTLNYLEAARANQVKRFVFASSGAPLGQQEPPIHENMAPRPLSPYGASKLAGEGYCSAYHGSFGLETVLLRFGNVYGPLSAHKGSVVAKFIRHLLDHEPLPVYGDGGQTRDFIFIDDLVRAIYLAATVQNLGGQTFQIATHREHTVIEVAQALNELAWAHLGHTSDLLHESEKKGEIRRNFSDISKAKALLGFDPKFELKNGLEQTFLWFLRDSEYD